MGLGHRIPLGCFSKESGRVLHFTILSYDLQGLAIWGGVFLGVRS